MTKDRDYRKERETAKNKLAERFCDLVDLRFNGQLGDDDIKLAQAMILCTLPYRRTSERSVVRTSRLGNGATLKVTFTAGRDGIDLPYGADRKLLAWIFDRAIQRRSPRIPWASASEYRKEVGLSYGGSALKQIEAQFERISGMVVDIVRPGMNKGRMLTVVEDYYLPGSLGVQTLDSSGVQPPDYGITLSPTLYADISRYNISVPRKLWAESKAPPQVADIMFWLYWRIYSAQTETVIPWEAFQEQFDPDQYLWRVKDNAKKAVHHLKALWREANIAIEESGIWVDRSPGMLEDDATKGRVRGRQQTFRLFDV